jgi:hypothetical protein
MTRPYPWAYLLLHLKPNGIASRHFSQLNFEQMTHAVD